MVNKSNVLLVILIVLTFVVLGLLRDIGSKVDSIEEKVAYQGRKITVLYDFVGAEANLEMQEQEEQEEQEDKDSIIVGKPFSELEFEDLKGNTVNINRLKGKVVLIDFWATWCGPCTAEIPNLLSVYEDFKDKGLEIIGISLDKDRQRLDDYLEKHEIQWPNYYDGKGWDNEISSRFGVHGIPKIILIDREGIVRKIGLRGDRIREAVAGLFGQDVKKQSIPSIDPKEWKDEYIVELKAIDDIRISKFGVNWYRPHRLEKVSTEKPDFIKSLPTFKYDMQRYLTFRLGNAEDNQIFAVIDFRKPDQKYFPFDLYLDRERNGNLVDDFIENSKHITGIQIPYDDGTTESYSLNLYSCGESVRLAYQSLTGRYGFFDVDHTRIQLLVLDNTGDGIFNDREDVILMDWDLDGKIDGSHQADEEVPLYSLLELPGVSYQVVEFDPPGRRMVLQRISVDVGSLADDIQHDPSVKAIVEKTKKELSTSKQYSRHGALVYQIRSADGQLSRARTEFHWTGHGRGGYRPGRISEGETKVMFDRDGQSAELRVIHPDYHEFRRPITLEKRKTIVWDDIVLERVSASSSCIVKGIVHLEDDANPAGIQVSGGGKSETTTNEDGEFILSNLRSGEIRIYARKPGYHGLYTTVQVKKGEMGTCELKGYRIRKAKVRWAFQPDGSKNFSKDNIVNGTAVLQDNVLDRVSFSEGFKQVRGKSDFYVHQKEDTLLIRNIDVRRNGPAFIEIDGSFDDLIEAPDFGYNRIVLTLKQGKVYVFRTYDGEKYAKMEVLEIID